MAKPLVSKAERSYRYPVEQVWSVVVDNGDFAWRSDVVRLVEEPGGSRWRETDAAGRETRFSLLEKVPFERYAFSMENAMFTGRWSGQFLRQGQGCKLVFVEEIMVKNPVARFIARHFWHLEKMQNTYFDDLEAKLQSLS